MKYYLPLLVLFFVGCASQLSINPNNPTFHPNGAITTSNNKILTLPSQELQDYLVYHPNYLYKQSQILKKHYLQKYFSPWQEAPKHDGKQASWGASLALNNPGFGENYIPNSKALIQSLIKEANFKALPSTSKKAIIIRSTNLRVLPTHKPRFLNPKQSGEGFPFDYWQNSSIYANTPILITHYSLSKSWAYVESGFVSGWVHVQDIAILNDEQIQTIQQSQDFIISKKDYSPIYTQQHEFIENARIGMLLPVIGSTKKVYESLLFQRNQRGYAKAIKVHLSTQDFQKFPLVFSPSAFSSIARHIVGEKYGWGGMFGNRDCSMFLRDMYTPFGIWFERNSQAQIRQKNHLGEAHFINLQSLSTQEKIDLIKQEAIPFATLFGMKGHIMLFIGIDGDKIMILHDIWGIKTLQNNKIGREIIGRVAITPIDIGKGIHPIKQDSLLINQITSMKHLFDHNELSYD